jgi:hypothetical protein
MGRVAPAFNQFLRGSLDGIPLDLASTLLPRSTYLRFGILIHIHLHARSQKRYANGSPRHGTAPVRLTRDPKPGFVDSLQALVRNLAPGRFHTEWMNYYRDASHYSSQAECSKKRAVETVLERTRPSLVYDIGGNTGEYSRLATARAIDCVCYDIDPMCVHHNYERARAENDTHMLPLLMDFSNPSPSLGFDLRERTSFIERSRGDLVLALALIHHLRITANAPFEMIARFLARLGRQLLIEFVPKHDIKAQVLLQSRPDTFQDYTENGFRTSFERHFEFQDSFPIADTARTLYLLRVKS